MNNFDIRDVKLNEDLINYCGWIMFFGRKLCRDCKLKFVFFLNGLIRVYVFNNWVYNMGEEVDLVLVVYVMNYICVIKVCVNFLDFIIMLLNILLYLNVSY